VAVAADILSVKLTPPGEIGAAVVVENTAFRNPMGYGGPHAAYFATKESMFHARKNHWCIARC
jgi:glycine dehydrogenase